MADQPKRSAFDPDPPKVKGVPASDREKSQDSSDKSTTPDHAKGLLDSIKGLIDEHMKGAKAPGGTDSEGKQQTVDSAVDQMSQAVKAAPGGTTYG